MGRKLIDITNKRFGRLLVVRRTANNKNGTHWLCKCDCGNICEKTSSHMIGGLTQSCGCLNKENGKKHITHNMSTTRFYRIWSAMKARCKWNKRRYKDVQVCKRWLLFDNFKKDMYNDYIKHVSDFGEKNTTIERNDNNNDYCPNNCRWATYKEQARNNRLNRLITYSGKTQTVACWAEEMNIQYRSLLERINLGWSIEDCFNRPIKTHIQMITYGGETKSISAWAKELGINKKTIYYRIKNGQTIEESFFTPSQRINKIQ